MPSKASKFKLLLACVFIVRSFGSQIVGFIVGFAQFGVIFIFFVVLGSSTMSPKGGFQPSIVIFFCLSSAAFIPLYLRQTCLGAIIDRSVLWSTQRNIRDGEQYPTYNNARLLFKLRNAWHVCVFKNTNMLQLLVFVIFHISLTQLGLQRERESVSE